jgi:hypothetical protein
VSCKQHAAFFEGLATGRHAQRKRAVPIHTKSRLAEQLDGTLGRRHPTARAHGLSVRLVHRTSRKHPLTARKRHRGATLQKQALERWAALAQQDDGGCIARNGDARGGTIRTGAAHRHADHRMMTWVLAAPPRKSMSPGSEGGHCRPLQQYSIKRSISGTARGRSTVARCINAVSGSNMLEKQVWNSIRISVQSAYGNHAHGLCLA